MAWPPEKRSLTYIDDEGNKHPIADYITDVEVGEWHLSNRYVGLVQANILGINQDWEN